MGIFSLFFLVPFVVIFALLLPIIAIIDILNSKFEGNDNLLMLLIVVLIPFGAILYFFVSPTRKIKK
jgi:hypothetical protein